MNNLLHSTLASCSHHTNCCFTSHDIHVKTAKNSCAKSRKIKALGTGRCIKYRTKDWLPHDIQKAVTNQLTSSQSRGAHTRHVTHDRSQRCCKL